MSCRIKLCILLQTYVHVLLTSVCSSSHFATVLFQFGHAPAAAHRANMIRFKCAAHFIVFFLKKKGKWLSPYSHQTLIKLSLYRLIINNSWWMSQWLMTTMDVPLNLQTDCSHTECPPLVFLSLMVHQRRQSEWRWDIIVRYTVLHRVDLTP